MERTAVTSQNVVVNVKIGSNGIDISRFRLRLPYIFRPQNLEATIVRLHRDNLTTLLLFRTGKAVIESKSVEQAIWAMHRMRIELLIGGIPTETSGFSVVNMVYGFRLPGTAGVDLERINRDHTEITVWAPLVFPGLMLHIGGVLVRLFETLEAVMMGIDKQSQAVAVIRSLSNLSVKYRIFH